MKRSLPLILLIVIGLLISACGSGQPMNMSWAGLSASKDAKVAYLANGLHVYAVNVADGTQLWKYPEQANAAAAFYATPVLSQDGTQLLVGDYGNVFHSLDPQTGAEKWKYDQIKGRIVGSPLATADGIYVPSTDHNLYALTLEGQFRWSFTATHAIWAQPVTDGKLIYAASMDHFIYAIDPQNGIEKWKLDLGGAIYAAPLLDNGVLYVGTLANQIVAVDTLTQKILWTYATEGGIWGTPILKDGKLYTGDTAGYPYILDIKNGTGLKLPALKGAIIAGPVFTDNGFIIVTEGGTIYFKDLEGNAVSEASVTGKLYTSPVLAGGDVLLAENSSSFALQLMNVSGGQKWSFEAK
ncbi:MAG TPA: PQQ-like beta-propeller repeat protein [Anaerolineaceae bacterium]|nr:PQQ-like beta-propeller repeat protein [Anaerolineaceae bacterium]HPN50625.1 PQQ-like beta-propeller repeat protein [Anaerolineaceae bacterium]